MSEINPGIRLLVGALNAAGFKTTDSGDGETHDYDCDRPYGYVVTVTPPSSMAAEADRLKELLEFLGFEPVVQAPDSYELTPNQCHIQASYCPCDGVAVIDVQHVHDRIIIDKSLT